MNESLISRIKMQLDPVLVQEFIVALAEDEKKIKALELILEKRVDVNELYFSDTCKQYNEDHRELTKKEFKILKEVVGRP